MYEYPHFLYFLLYSLYNDMRSIHNHISFFFLSRVTKTYKELISAFPIVLSMSSLLPLLLRPSTRPFQQFLSFPSRRSSHTPYPSFAYWKTFKVQRTTLSPILHPYVVFYSTFYFAHPFQLSLCLPPPPS